MTLTGPAIPKIGVGGRGLQAGACVRDWTTGIVTGMVATATDVLVGQVFVT